jgi:hypothetical protein
MSFDLSSIKESLANGVDPREAAFADMPTSGTQTPQDDETEEVDRITDGEQSDSVDEGSEEAAKGDESKVGEGTTEEKKPEAKGDTETVVWGGREVVIDYSNRDQIKKDKALAIGARKWQAERDELQKSLKDIQPDYEDAKSFRDTITSSWESKGLEGLVNLLTKDEGGYKKFLAQEIEKERAYASATPEQKAVMDERRANEQLRKELEADRKLREKLIEEQTKRQETITKNAEELNQSTFKEITGGSAKKFSFADKLGNPDIETALDSKVWSKVRDELNKMPEETELTPKLMDSLFSKHFETLNKSLNIKTQKEVEKKVEEKKVAAQTKVAATASSSMNRPSSVEEFEKAGNDGDWSKMLKMAFKGKVKVK